MISEILRTARTRELKQQQQAESLRPGTEIGRSEREDLDAAIESAPFYEDEHPESECDVDSCRCERAHAYQMLGSEYKQEADRRHAIRQAEQALARTPIGEAVRFEEVQEHDLSDCVEVKK